MMSSSPRTMVAIPSGSSWDAKTGICLCNLFVDHMTRGRGSLGIHSKQGSILPELRQKLVETAIAQDMTHVLFVDSDMEFPADGYRRLLQHNKQVVGCNYAIKTLPSSPNARKIEKGNPKGKVLFTRPWDKGLERVWRFGFGFVLIDLRVFQEIKKPWFPITWIEDAEEFQGEDWGFCQKVDDAGIPMYIDQELSWEIIHGGRFPFTHEVIDQQLMIQEFQERELEKEAV